MVRQKDTSKIQFDEFLDLDAYEVGAPSPVAPQPEEEGQDEEEKEEKGGEEGAGLRRTRSSSAAAAAPAPAGRGRGRGRGGGRGRGRGKGRAKAAVVTPSPTGPTLDAASLALLRRARRADPCVRWRQGLREDRASMSCGRRSCITAPVRFASTPAGADDACTLSFSAVDLPSVSNRASVLRAGLGKGHYTAFAKPGPAIERGGSPGPGDEEPAPGTGEWGACRRDSFVDSDKDALVRRRCIVGSDVRCFGCSGVQ